MSKEKINFCEGFIQKICGKQGIENKTRYLLEDFFYQEGWSSMTNPKAMKEGHHQEFTYPKSTIAHFIEDFVRLIQHEFKQEIKEIEKAFKKPRNSKDSGGTKNE